MCVFDTPGIEIRKGRRVKKYYTVKTVKTTPRTVSPFSHKSRRRSHFSTGHHKNSSTTYTMYIYYVHNATMYTMQHIMYTMYTMQLCTQCNICNIYATYATYMQHTMYTMQHRGMNGTQCYVHNATLWNEWDAMWATQRLTPLRFNLELLIIKRATVWCESNMYQLGVCSKLLNPNKTKCVQVYATDVYKPQGVWLHNYSLGT